jgi:3-hydroxyacyl-CoA dehydrogenase
MILDFDATVVGAGVVGLAIARRFVLASPSVLIAKFNPGRATAAFSIIKSIMPKRRTHSAKINQNPHRRRLQLIEKSG